MTALRLNGAPRSLPDGATVADAVQALVPGSGEGVAVAVDGQVVRRADWATTALPDGAQVEVLTAMQGG